MLDVVQKKKKVILKSSKQQPSLLDKSVSHLNFSLLPLLLFLLRSGPLLLLLKENNKEINHNCYPTRNNNSNRITINSSKQCQWQHQKMIIHHQHPNDQIVIKPSKNNFQSGQNASGRLPAKKQSSLNDSTSNKQPQPGQNQYPQKAPQCGHFGYSAITAFATSSAH